MTDSASNLDTIRRLVELVAEHGLSELTVEDGDTVVSVKGAADAVPSQAVHFAPHAAFPVHPAGHAHPHAAPVAAPEAPRHEDTAFLASPMVGVFYRSPSPEDPPFVHVGDTIRVGQTIGLIEAMKVYSEIPAEASGRVIEIAAENATLVQQGQPLIYIQPL